MQIISQNKAACILQDGWTVVPGGFGSCGHPDALTLAVSQRYKNEGHPKDLTLLFASAPGDSQGHGVDVLAQPGLVKRAIGGFWGLAPSLAGMALRGEIEAHNWPQGVISQLYRMIAGGKPGVLSSIGINTFVDPDGGGGRLNKRTNTPLVQKISINGEPLLFYPSLDINCVLLRGTTSDSMGNISMEKEVSFSDALSQAMAAKNSGGIVVVQVERLVNNYQITPSHVHIPGVLVDYVVVSPVKHPQTYGKSYNPDFITAGNPMLSTQTKITMPFAEQVIVRLAIREIKKLNAKTINLGIGIPALIGQATGKPEADISPVLTIESGIIGGRPATGLSFGASYHPQAIIEQSFLFDFYDGGGLDLSCLGFAEVDEFGNVNASLFNNKLYGAGGFINLSQSTDTILFCGTFMADGLDISPSGNGIRIVHEGNIRKFVKRVSHLTFSGVYSRQLGQNVKFITERAVFTLKDGVICLDEILAGVKIDTDILPNIEGNFVISANCQETFLDSLPAL